MHFQWKTENMSRFALEFPFQYLDFLIEISKYWNGNSMAKRSDIQTSHFFIRQHIRKGSEKGNVSDIHQTYPYYDF